MGDCSYWPTKLMSRWLISETQDDRVEVNKSSWLHVFSFCRIKSCYFAPLALEDVEVLVLSDMFMSCLHIHRYQWASVEHNVSHTHTYTHIHARAHTHTHTLTLPCLMTLLTASDTIWEWYSRLQHNTVTIKMWPELSCAHVHIQTKRHLKSFSKAWQLG